MKSFLGIRTKRKLISKSEDKISWLQVIGFLLILAGILYLVLNMFFGGINAEEVAIIFFDIMLGVAFAFPDMLKDDSRQVSTMRIVVFMVVNVICMLLLKIGWDKPSFKEIGIDQYWMGIIAFLFGAKAAQSFFESRMSTPKETPKAGIAAIQFTNAEIAKLAVEQNQQYLKVKFPNILSISDAVHDLGQTESHVITLYLKDNNTVGIPDRLEVKMPDGKIKTIPTEIIKGVSNSKIHVHQGEKINTANQTDFGSVCCLVTSSDDKNFKGVVTAGHVYSGGNATNMRGALSAADQKRIFINEALSGKWIFQLITNGQDIAIAELEDASEDSSNISFKENGYHVVKDSDVKLCNVTLVSRMSGMRQGFILDYNLGFDVPYDDIDKFMSKIILIGSTANRNDSKTLSRKGDSGGCVYTTQTKQLVGLILGGDDKFTYVLPVKDMLEKRNYQLV